MTKKKLDVSSGEAGQEGRDRQPVGRSGSSRGSVEPADMPSPETVQQQSKEAQNKPGQSRPDQVRPGTGRDKAGKSKRRQQATQPDLHKDVRKL